MTARGVVAILRNRATAAALALTVCLGVGAPGAAFAQEQPLPDPNGSAAAEGTDREAASAQGGSGQGGGLPQTGLFAVPVLAAGLALLATGVATRPARRRRRDYSCDMWWDAVTAPGDDPRSGDGR